MSHGFSKLFHKLCHLSPRSEGRPLLFFKFMQLFYTFFNLVTALCLMIVLIPPSDQGGSTCFTTEEIAALLETFCGDNSLTCNILSS